MQRTGPIVYIWTLFNLLLYTKMTAFQKLLSDKRRVVITRPKATLQRLFVVAAVTSASVNETLASHGSLYGLNLAQDHQCSL